MHANLFQVLSPFFKGLFYQHTNSDDFCPRYPCQSDQALYRLAGCQKIIDDQDPFLRSQVFRGDDQFHGPTFGVGWR